MIGKKLLLEDNINYVVVMEIENYLYLTNENDCYDFCIRKVVDDVLCFLDSEDEYNEALELFKNKFI